MNHVALLVIAAASLLIAAPVFAATEGEPAGADLARGQSISTQVCAACHAADGSRGAPVNPIIAGQHPEYLVKQLAEFKSGKRENPIMKGMAAALSEEDMVNVAAFYASKQAKQGFARNKDTIRLGEKIYRGGILERKVPACAGCHGPTGVGIPAQFPRLSGQHSEYTEAQLIAFRSGGRVNSAQMMAIAAPMSDREIKAVADYVAGLR